MQNQYIDLLKIVIAMDELEQLLQYPGARIVIEGYKQIKFAYCVYQEEGEQKKVYLGRYSPELKQSLDACQKISGYRSERNHILQDFRKRGFPRLSSEAEQVIDALARNGFFRLRGVLIGTNAFIQYPAMFGQMKYFETNSEINTMMTTDVDFAMFHSISVKLGAENQEMAETFEHTIKQIGEFEPQHDHSGQFVGRWRDKNGFEVDLLTPFRREAKVNKEDIEHDERLTFANLGDLEILPMKFLDFLIHDEMRAVALSKSGILVNVPRPEKFAIHKLIVSEIRGTGIDGQAFTERKKRKDIMQAKALIRCLHANDPDALQRAWSEANERGPKWRAILASAIRKLPPKIAWMLDPDIKDKEPEVKAEEYKPTSFPLK